RVQCVGDRVADAGQAGTGEPWGIRLRPVRGQVAGIRPNGNALFQRRPPARAIGANVTEHVATEEAVADHATAAVCVRRAYLYRARLPDSPQMREPESALIFQPIAERAV